MNVRRRFARLPRLLLVGAALLGGLRAESAEPSAEDDTTLVLWNVRNFGTSDHFIAGERREGIMKPTRELQAMVAILKHLDPDILAVNEVISTEQDRYVRALADLLRRHGLDYPHTATIRGDDPRIQNVLLSRLPLRDVRRLDRESFTLQRHSASTGAALPVTMRPLRGFLSATVTLPGDQEVALVLTHLKSKAREPEIRGEDPAIPGDEAIRLEEMRLLTQALDNLLRDAPNRPLILLGDLNDTPNSRSLRLLRDWARADEPDHPVLVDLELTDYLGDRWTHFYFPEKAYNVLDYVWLSPSLLKQVVAGKSFVYRERNDDPARLHSATASDHRPLVLRLRPASIPGTPHQPSPASKP